MQAGWQAGRQACAAFGADWGQDGRRYVRACLAVSPRQAAAPATAPLPGPCTVYSVHEWQNASPPITPG